MVLLKRVLQRACIFLPPTPFPTTGIEMPPSHAVLSRPWLTATSTSSLRIELALPQASWSWMPSAAFADRAQSHGAIFLRIKSPCEQRITPLEKAPTCCFACPYFKGGFYPLAAPADSSEPVVASRASTFSLGAGPSSSSPALSASSAPSSALPDPDRHKPMFKLPGSSAPSDPDRHKPAFKLSVLRAF